MSIAAPTRCFGQFEVTPYAGVYIPTRMVDDGSGGFFGSGGYVCDLNFDSTCISTTHTRQRTAAMAGARVTGWLAPRFGVDLAFGYSPSGLEVEGRVVGSGSVATVTAGVLARITPLRSSTSVALLGGGALVTHAYTSGAFSGTSSSWGPVLGLEGRTQFARLFAARVRIEDYHYRLDHSLLGPLVGTGGPYTQNDVVVSAGLDVALVGRQ